MWKANRSKYTWEIGVLDFKVLSSVSCPKHADRYCSFELSLALSGDFYDAALKDQLDLSIDYDVLTKSLEALLIRSSCLESLSLKKMLNDEISRKFALLTNYSLQIKSGCQQGFYS
jgi:hypothetical protein